MTRWVVSTVLDVITEIVLVVLPAERSRHLEVDSSRKAQIIVAFSFRLAVAALSITTATTYFDYIHNSTSRAQLAWTVAFEEILVASSLVTASIPCIRGLLLAFESEGLRIRGESLQTPIGSRDGSRQLRSQHSRDNRTWTSTHTQQQRYAQNAEQAIRFNEPVYAVNVTATERQRDHITGRTETDRERFHCDDQHSDSSERMIIRREWKVEVHRN